MIYLLLAALSATALAETTALKVFNAGETTLPLSGLEASVVGANALATTLALQCKDNANKSLCAIEDPITITEGPSTFTMSGVYSTKVNGVDATMTQIQDCDITSSTQSASCSISIRVEVSTGGRSTATSTSTEMNIGSDDIYYRPLTVTAGVDKLRAPEATQTPDAAAGGASGNVGIGGVAAAAVAAAAMGLL